MALHGTWNADHMSQLCGSPAVYALSRTVLMDPRVLAGFVPAGTDPAHPGL
jgi:hypothetical protein